MEYCNIVYHMQGSLGIGQVYEELGITVHAGQDKLPDPVLGKCCLSILNIYAMVGQSASGVLFL